MNPAESALRQAQAAAERARRLLLFPSVANLEASRAWLEQACTALEEIRQSLGAQQATRKPELLAGLGVFRRTARRAAALIERAGRFHAGWIELLRAAASAGYTREGAPATPAGPASLSVEG